ncbi:hypothetical protein [Pelagibacterium sp.]|uniref:hypothetical protein n=1 Tax=Pelagibacterium sp. TaxID=1967288 RepID=UPI003A904926
MSWLDAYRDVRYRDGARGEVVDGVVEHDCWSLARTVRHEVYGKPLLPSWGHVRNTMPREFARAHEAVSSECLEECAPEVGAVAAVFRARLVTHVGVVVEVDGRLAVLDIRGDGLPVRWQWVADFESRYLRVIYYRDKT